MLIELEVSTRHWREAGVRSLGRQIATVCRKVARQIAEGRSEPTHVTADQLERFLGRAQFRDEIAERTERPGVAVGLAWTPTGGDVLFVEATMMPSSGEHLLLTGMLGDVMRESAQAALSYGRSNAAQLGVDPSVFKDHMVHLHVPAGAIPKDGPSAGVTMLTALTSVATGRCVCDHLAMTGEITLRGKVLPVGGIKEKVLAAHRSGIRTVILPRDNERDLEDVPVELLRELKIIPVDSAEEVLSYALELSSLQPVLRTWWLQTQRLQAFRGLEKRRGSRVIGLIHRQETMSFLGFPIARYIDIEDSEAVLRAIQLTDPDVPIDLILHTPGGLVLAATQIADALRAHPSKVTVFVPHYAMSGATVHRPSVEYIPLPYRARDRELEPARSSRGGLDV